MKINLDRLRKELGNAPAYVLPEKGDGYLYAYERLYRPFMQGREISLGALDFEAFSSEDVLDLSVDYHGRFFSDLAQLDSIKWALRKTAPLPAAVPFL